MFISDSSTGRKEIVMFFWLYAVIELLAIFLDSGIIPTANSSYPVCFNPYKLVLAVLMNCYSGSPRRTQAWWRLLILASLSTDLLGSSLRRTAHHCRYGYVVSPETFDLSERLSS